MIDEEQANEKQPEARQQMVDAGMEACPEHDLQIGKLSDVLICIYRVMVSAKNSTNVKE
jgi:hypothetical protein